MRVRFSGALLRFTDYHRTVDIGAGTMGTALRELEERFPLLSPVLRDDDGDLRRVHQVFLNGEKLGDLSDALVLHDSDELEFLTPLAGG